MRLETRRLLDHAFSGMGMIAMSLTILALAVILGWISAQGIGAFIFRSTVEHRSVMLDHWARGNPDEVAADQDAADRARQPVYDMLAAFEAELAAMPAPTRMEYESALGGIKKVLAELFGPAPGEETSSLVRSQYGAVRWDRAQQKLESLLFDTQWDHSGEDKIGVKVRTPRSEQFSGTALEPLFDYTAEHFDSMMRPRWTFYWRFLFDTSKAAHFFGGIGPEVLGTLYLTLGAMIFAVPMGVISAIYLCEYARPGRRVSFLRICISTLAGVPGIVFGLFGLAFFLNTLHIPKSVLAGSMTLALLVVPTVIRASEEAIRSVPKTYREAALSLGAGRWHAIRTVILPSALPGILTGVIISMARAAGATAPIIFVAAVSFGRPLLPLQAFSQPTPALSWNIYNLSAEHAAADEIRHVQYGMVLTLVALVLLLNGLAMTIRARISKKLRG